MPPIPPTVTRSCTSDSPGGVSSLPDLIGLPDYVCGAQFDLLLPADELDDTDPLRSIERQMANMTYTMIRKWYFLLRAFLEYYSTMGTISRARLHPASLALKILFVQTAFIAK